MNQKVPVWLELIGLAMSMFYSSLLNNSTVPVGVGGVLH